MFQQKKKFFLCFDFLQLLFMCSGFVNNAVDSLLDFLGELQHLNKFGYH